jgi:3-hydroxybutyryl-CoA dehydrogenase
MTNSVKKIAVIGAGTMGRGIAQLCATAGYQVLLFDIQPELTKTAISLIGKTLDTSVQKGKLAFSEKEGIIDRIFPVNNFSQLQVDMVIEAAIEKLDVKQNIFQELEKINEKECILASNTSSISITEIASALTHPNRFAGLHFFNPAPVMKLVELIRGSATSDPTIQFLTAFAKRLNKEPVLAQDSPGFIVNRVARHFYLESLKIVDEQVADFRSVDMLMKSAGFKMGPFELMDLIGIDVNYSVTTSIYHAFHEEPRFRPSHIQEQKVNAGHLGKKTGRGFYEY